MKEHPRDCVEENEAAYTVTHISASDCTSAAVWPKGDHIQRTNKFKLLSSHVDKSYDRYQPVETSAVNDIRNSYYFND